MAALLRCSEGIGQFRLGEKAGVPRIPTAGRSELNRQRDCRSIQFAQLRAADDALRCLFVKALPELFDCGAGAQAFEFLRPVIDLIHGIHYSSMPGYFE